MKEDPGTDRQTDRQTERQTDRNTDRQTDRQIIPKRQPPDQEIKQISCYSSTKGNSKPGQRFVVRPSDARPYVLPCCDKESPQTLKTQINPSAENRIKQSVGPSCREPNLALPTAQQA